MPWYQEYNDQLEHHCQDTRLGADMQQTRIIKRYANRKLYDTEHSRYVTLEQISEMIRKGDDVKIVDNKSKEDLTTVTLAQIIFEEEKKQRSFMPLATMRNIIQNGGEWFAEAQRRVQSILPGKKREDGEPDVDGVPDENPKDHASSNVALEGHDEAGEKKMNLATLRTWVDDSKSTLDEWQRRVDGKIRSAIEGISPFAGVNKDVRALSDRIAELESKLRELEQQDEQDNKPA
jgi:polyhydroxyalkanoate synthesis repressor PhaR